MSLNYLLVPLVPSEPPLPKKRGQSKTRGQKAKAIYDLRRRRERFLAADLMGEPGWDILLLLYFLEEEGKPAAITGLCAGSGVPSTTGLRWIRLLEKRGFICREPDENDKRRTWVTLTDAGRTVMDSILDEY